MGLDISLQVEGLDPDLYEKIFGSKPTSPIVARAGGAEGFAVDRISTDKWTWTVHPELSQTGPCLRCRSLEGVVFRRDDFGAPIPPLHPRCVCSPDPYYEEGHPLLDGRRPKRPMGLYQVLKKLLSQLSGGKLIKSVGKRVARLMRLGKVKSEDLISMDRGLKSAEEVIGEFGVTLSELDRLTDVQVRALRRVKLPRRLNPKLAKV